MLRNGWPDTPRYHSEKSDCSLDISKRTLNERNCTCLAEPWFLTETANYITWKRNTCSVVRTRKLQSKFVNRKNVSDAARIMKSQDQSENKALRQIFSQFNLDLSRINDLSESLVKKNEFLDVYEKKLTIYISSIPKTSSDYGPITCISNLYKLAKKCVTKLVQIEVERRILLIDNPLGELYNEIKSRKQHSKVYMLEITSYARPRDDAVFCSNRDRNVFWGAEGIFNTATIVRCIHLTLLNIYKLWSLKRIRSHSVQEILDRACKGKKDTRIKTDVRIRCNRPDILVLDKRQNMITLIKKYDLFTNNLCLTYVKRLQMLMNNEAYIQAKVLRRQSKHFLSEPNAKESRESKSKTPLKQLDSEEDDVANEDSKLEDELEDVKIGREFF
ncbi:hypothetical protein CWI38_0452p0020 [Hamiltosporidium tvaerminnensis]|uniref:Uncharacterized protein n=1 Tax=Hamiltosporidium tvaerminnensis TaxID=1176355 RepID=A0A4Q9M024_9MICR|nr:hypothetical protein CWI38_0452p0020 [Hamiltosporidium tvaerminnensis]